MSWSAFEYYIRHVVRVKPDTTEASVTPDGLADYLCIFQDTPDIKTYKQLMRYVDWKASDYMHPAAKPLWRNYKRWLTRNPDGQLANRKLLRRLGY